MVTKVRSCMSWLIFDMTDTICFSNLNRRRYAQNDDTLYVAPEDERTDYVGFI